MKIQFRMSSRFVDPLDCLLDGTELVSVTLGGDTGYSAVDTGSVTNVSGASTA